MKHHHTIVKTLFFALITTAIITACNNKSRKEKSNDYTLSIVSTRLAGDNSVYGLACEGCSDSVLVMLPEGKSNPVRYNILHATRMKHIMGKIKIGDQIAIVPNKENPLVADFVVDIDDLKGTWCYIVMPHLREDSTMTPALRNKLLREMPDSIKEIFMIPREYGFSLQRRGSAQSVGYVQENSLDNENPFAYPQLGYFTEWCLWNGKLIIKSATPVFSKNRTSPAIKDVRNDTCNIDYLQGDSLVLSADGVSRSYYRKSNLSEVNKQAKAIAAERQKKVLEDIKTNR